MNTPPMDESIDLSPQPLKRQPNMAGGNTEGAALRALVGHLNNPIAMGHDVDPTKRIPIPSEVQVEIDQTLRGGIAGGGATLVQGVPPPSRAAAPAPASFEPAPADFTKVFFTGRLFAGKDHCADTAGYAKVGLADPIYAIVSGLTGVKITATEGKDVPGIRAMLQMVGQYGRGTVDEKYPWTLTRVMFLEYMKEKYPDFMEDGYGRNENFWINRLTRAVDVRGPGARVACTNVRFKNEFDELKSIGFEHWHVMTSPAEWEARLAKKGLTKQSKEVQDTSEQFAITIDRGFAAKVREPGGKMRCIWNSALPIPSPRLYSVAEFVARVSGGTPVTATAPADVFTED